MMYTARHYVRIAGRIYAPGVSIVAALEPAQHARLLRLGAITPADGAYEAGDPLTLDAMNAMEPEAEEDCEISPEIDPTDGIVTRETDADEGVTRLRNTRKRRKGEDK